mgnify:CR=1 FL=1
MSLMIFDDIPYKNVICTGVMSGSDGRKMSKSYKNYPDPKKLLEQKGGEALRLYIMSTPIMAGGDISWSDDLLNDQIKDVLIPIWNTYRYLTLYANIHNWSPESTEFTSENLLDKWIESYMKDVSIKYAQALESYDIPTSVKLIQPCIDNISKWWIRRSRDRFAQGNVEALQTLYATMVMFSKIFAPQMPFLTEEIYQTLVVKSGIKGGLESVHLEIYPEVKKEEIDEKLLSNMDIAREICSNGLKVREDSQLNLRQPLAKAYIGVKDDFIMEIVKSELNLLEVEYSEKPLEGNGLITSGEFEKYVTIDTNLTQELKADGYYNEFVRKFRDIRKKNGLNFGDFVDLKIYISKEELLKVLEKPILDKKEELQCSSITFVNEVVDSKGEFVIEDAQVKLSF